MYSCTQWSRRDHELWCKRPSTVQFIESLLSNKRIQKSVRLVEVVSVTREWMLTDVYFKSLLKWDHRYNYSGTVLNYTVSPLGKNKQLLHLRYWTTLLDLWLSLGKLESSSFYLLIRNMYQNITASGHIFISSEEVVVRLSWYQASVTNRYLSEPRIFQKKYLVYHRLR